MLSGALQSYLSWKSTCPNYPDNKAGLSTLQNDKLVWSLSWCRKPRFLLSFLPGNSSWLWKHFGSTSIIYFSKTEIFQQKRRRRVCFNPVKTYIFQKALKYFKKGNISVSILLFLFLHYLGTEQAVMIIDLQKTSWEKKYYRFRIIQVNGGISYQNLE